MRSWFSVFERWDWPLQLAVLALTSASLLVIYGIDVSRGGGLFQFEKQLVATVIGLILCMIVARADYRRFRSLGAVFGISALLLLLVVLPFGSGARSVGRFSFLGALTFQPVEIVKVLMVLSLAWYLARHVHDRLHWIPFFGSAALALLCSVFVFLQPDFGSAIVVLVIWLSMVLFCGLPRHAWWIGIVTIALVSTVTWSFVLKPYQKERLLTFMNPQVDPLGAGYNVMQARIAVGSGGWFGKGIQ
jgi:rod shape determining protein RodA